MNIPITLYSQIVGVWPTTGNFTPQPLQDGYGPRILSGLYDFHRGIDIPGSINDPIYPILPGIVVRTLRQFTPVEYATLTGPDNNININSPGPISGVIPSPGTRILVKDGSFVNNGPNSVDNGIYIYDTAVTPLVRSSDFNSGVLLAGSRVYDINTAQNWELQTTINTINVDPVTWTVTSNLQRFGNFIVVSHSPIRNISTHQTVYQHLNTIAVSQGQTITQKTILGGMGNTGYQISTIHLHCEHYIGINNGNIQANLTVNPLDILHYDKRPPAITAVKVGADIQITVIQNAGSMDIVRYVFTPNNQPVKILDYNTREGMNPGNDDTNPFDGIEQTPVDYTTGDPTMTNVIKYLGLYTTTTTANFTAETVFGKEYNFTFNF